MMRILKVFGIALVVLVIVTVTWPRNQPKMNPRFKINATRSEDANLPLNQQRWVGTHDSASYKFLSGGVNPMVPLPGSLGLSISVNTLDMLQSWFGIVHNVLGHWTFTQQYDVFDQLKMGVRALDLRIAYSKEADEFVFAHTFGNEYAYKILNQIARFLQQNPNEFIIIISKPDFENRTSMEALTITARYLQLIKDTFGSRLLPVTPQFPTRQGATSAGHQILFSYSSDTALSDTFSSWVWPSDRFGGNWISTDDMEQDYQMYAAQLDTVTRQQIAPQQLQQAFLYHTPSTNSIKAAYLDRVKFWTPEFTAKWKQGGGSVISNGIYTQREWLCRLLKEKPFETLDRINIFWFDAPQQDTIQLIHEFQLPKLQKEGALQCPF
jgi:hypothetical protein